jgi:hypothetical protein
MATTTVVFERERPSSSSEEPQERLDSGWPAASTTAVMESSVVQYSEKLSEQVQGSGDLACTKKIGR